MVTDLAPDCLEFQRYEIWTSSEAYQRKLGCVNRSATVMLVCAYLFYKCARSGLELSKLAARFFDFW